MIADLEPAAEERLPGYRAQSHGDPRPDHRQLRFQPAAAGHDLGSVGALVDAALAAGLPFEVLDRVGDVGVGTLDAALAQGAIQEVAGRADERVALLVLLVPGLLADQGQERVRAALAEHGRGRPLVQVTACAGCGFLASFSSVVTSAADPRPAQPYPWSALRLASARALSRSTVSGGVFCVPGAEPARARPCADRHQAHSRSSSPRSSTGGADRGAAPAIPRPRPVRPPWRRLTPGRWPGRVPPA